MQQQQEEERALDREAEETFYLLDVPVQVAVTDEYVDVPVASVDDVLIWEEPIDDL